MGNPALLIIDMQNDSCLPGAAFEVRGAVGVIPNVKKLLDAFRKHGLPVVHSAREYKADGTDIEITRRDRFLRSGGAFVPGTSGHAPVEGLEPVSGEAVVHRQRWSAFHKTDLETVLLAQEVELVVLAGVETLGSIRCSAYDALALDLEVVVASDATMAGDAEAHKANLRDMETVGIEVSSTDHIVWALPRRLGRRLRARRDEAKARQP